MGSQKNNDTSIGDQERILLFEWHATHFESWRSSLWNGGYTINHPRGMEAEEFHRATMTIALLRKFYLGNKDAVRIDLVCESMLNELPATTEPLRGNLEHLQEHYLEHLAPTRVQMGDGTEDFKQHMREVIYGLLIHSDEKKMRQLLDLPRSWIHQFAGETGAATPIHQLLATIRRCREDGTLNLPAPYPPIWEKAEPRGYSPEYIDRVTGFPRPEAAPEDHGGTPDQSPG